MSHDFAAPIHDQMVGKNHRRNAGEPREIIKDAVRQRIEYEEYKRRETEVGRVHPSDEIKAMLAR